MQTWKIGNPQSKDILKTSVGKSTKNSWHWFKQWSRKHIKLGNMNDFALSTSTTLQQRKFVCLNEFENMRRTIKENAKEDFCPIRVTWDENLLKEEMEFQAKNHITKLSSF